jgi:hypothetical protein
VGIADVNPAVKEMIVTRRVRKGAGDALSGEA